MIKHIADPHIRIAANIMHQGGVIAYPTEAVWGLGCDPFNEEAVKRLLMLKKRDPTKGLILVASTIEQFSPLLTELSAEQQKRLEDSWPGAITWLVPANDQVPPWICGRFSSVALRVSHHPIVQALCNAYDGPIVSTSANPQGKPSAVTSWQVRRYFQLNRCKSKTGVLNGMTKGCVGHNKKPSTIKDLLSNKIIR